MISPFGDPFALPLVHAYSPLSCCFQKFQSLYDSCFTARTASDMDVVRLRIDQVLLGGSDIDDDLPDKLSRSLNVESLLRLFERKHLFVDDQGIQRVALCCTDLDFALCVLMSV